MTITAKGKKGSAKGRYDLRWVLSFKVQGNTTQRINGLEGGQFDITFFGAGRNAKAARNLSNTYVLKNKPGFRDINNILFNTQLPPFDDVNARRALAQGLDLKTINVLANQGEGEVAQEVVDSKVLGYVKNPGYPTKQNVAQAKKLVKQYKAAHGGQFSVTLLHTNDPANTAEAELMKQQQYQPKSLPIMAASLYAMQKGYFDSVSVDRVKEFQSKLEDYLTTRKSELMDQLANEKTLDNVEADLKTALEDFKSSWK